LKKDKIIKRRLWMNNEILQLMEKSFKKTIRQKMREAKEKE
jgi:hypothetical protein